MELRIRDSQQVIDEGFANWLSSLIKTKLISNIGKYKLVNWDKYLTTSDSVNRLYKKDYRTSEVIIFAANNIVCSCVPGEVVITFDNTKFVLGFDRLRLSTIVKTINYGTLDIKGCPIFIDTLTYFEENIDTYIRLYYGL